MDKYKSENIDLVNLKKTYNFKISKDINEIKENDIFINCGSEDKNLFMISNLFFKYNEYESTEFKKDFIKSMLRVTNNQDKTLDLYKNYSHYKVLSDYSNSLYSNTYGIKIPKNLKKSKIFNKLVKESKINQKMDPIDKIAKLSKFVFNTFKYDDDFFDKENVNKIIPLEKLIEKRVGRCFESSIILFLLIKQDETLKNVITKVGLGALVDTSIKNKFLDLNKNQKNIIGLNKIELYEKLKEHQEKNLRDRKEDVLKKLKRIDNKSKKTNNNDNVLNDNDININELDKIDKKYIDYLMFYDYLAFYGHAWVSVLLNQNNKKQQYVLDPTNGGITLSKSLSLVLPTKFNLNWEGSENLGVCFSKK